MSGVWRSQSAVDRDGLDHHTHASFTGHQCCFGHIWRGYRQGTIHIILIISPSGESEIYVSLNQVKSFPDLTLLRNASAHLLVQRKKVG